MQVAEYAYTRLRSEFGRQCNFSDRSTEIHADIPPDEELSGLFIPRDPVDRSVQTSCCDFSEHYVNTPFAELVAAGVNHTEGGWPKDVSCTDIEQTTRHRKKLEKDDAYQLQFLAESKLIEHTILQNNAVDIYNDYFSDCDILSTADSGQPTIKVVNTFKDPNDIKRAVTSISWHPEGPDRVAVAHCIMRFQEHTPETSLESYVYKTDDLSRAESRLVSNFPTCSIRYSPKDVNTIVGGQNNGQVSVWDVRRGKMPVERSTLQFSHTDPVYKVIWVQSKTNTEFFTTSTDGQVLWWDMRKIAEPIDQMWIDPTKKNEKGPAEGGLCLDFESSMPTKFMVGSERGTAYVCTRKAKSPSERISLSFQCHYGPIYAIQRNPTYPKHFLTIGDWTAKIFSEDVRDSPIWWTAPAMQYPSDARWSATRPSVFYVSKMDGSLDVWDLLFRQKSPVLNVMVSDDSLMTLEMEEQGQLMAVGSEGGCLTILEISSNLAELQNNEKALFLSVSDDSLMTLEMEEQGQLMAVGSEGGCLTILEISSNLAELQNNEKALFLSMLEREAHREKILEGRAREKKLAAKVLETGGDVEKLSLHAEVEAAIAEAEANFRDMVSKERKRMERESETLRTKADEAAKDPKAGPYTASTAIAEEPENESTSGKTSVVSPPAQIPEGEEGHPVLEEDPSPLAPPAEGEPPSADATQPPTPSAPDGTAPDEAVPAPAEGEAEAPSTADEAPPAPAADAGESPAEAGEAAEPTGAEAAEAAEPATEQPATEEPATEQPATEEPAAEGAEAAEAVEDAEAPAAEGAPAGEDAEEPAADDKPS